MRTIPLVPIVTGVLCFIGISGASGADSVAADSNNDTRPNIVLVMADDMGFSDIGCYGGEIETPNLDRLAAGGLRFTSFYNTGRCCPTRASLLTGLYSHQAGVGHMTGNRGTPSYQGYLNQRCVTIGEALRSAGYTTGISGKWHVGSRPEHWPRRRGFDYFYGMPEGGGNFFYIREGRHLVVNDTPIERPDDWYFTEGITEHAVKFVEQAAAKPNPFFLYVAYTAPHWPLQARTKDIAKYRGRYRAGWDTIRQLRYQRLVELGIIDKSWPASDRDPASIPWDDEKQRDKMDLRMAVYAAQVDALDQGVGQIMAALKQAGRDENTLVLFLSDNGASAEGGRRGFTKGKQGAETGTPDSYDSYGLSWANASNTPFRWFKSRVHEGGISTPLIARWPRGIQRRGQLEAQVGHVIDLLPTCLDVAGMAYPERFQERDRLPPEGISLRNVFTGKPKQERTLFWEHEGNRAVRVGDWKLVAIRGKPWELYHLAADRTERNDLSTKDPARVKRLAGLWQAWADRCGVMVKEARSQASQPTAKTPAVPAAAEK